MVAMRTASSIIFLRLSNAAAAGEGRVNHLQEAAGLIQTDEDGEILAWENTLAVI